MSSDSVDRMLLREYRPDDLEAIHRINQGQVPAVGTETIEDLGAIADQSLIALVAEDDGDDGRREDGRGDRRLLPGARSGSRLRLAQLPLVHRAL